MNIDIKDVITLDDNNKYIVVSKVVYNNETYFYIVDINNNAEFKILKFNSNNQKLAEFEDANLVKILLPLFFNKTANSINMEHI